jgi:cyclophilin family peptidyl-prolyl cis-trans isomerase/protein-disulfide isomerase
MKHPLPKALLLFVVLALLLVACIPNQPVITVVPTLAATPVPPQPTTGSAVTQPTVVPTMGPATCEPGLNAIQPPTAEQVALVAKIPPVSETDMVRGPADAAVTILEYSDYQCPYCAQFAPILEQILKEFPNDVRAVFRHFPLPSHPNSLLATQAAEAAGLQGKFYEFSSLLFAQQATWSPMDSAAFETWLVSQVEPLGLNKDQFVADMKSDVIVKKVVEFQNQAMAAAVSYTPFIMVNGRIWEGTDLPNMRILIKLLREEKNLFPECPTTVLETGKQYTATIETEVGNIVLKLQTDKVPLSTNAFVWLVQHGWYDNTSFFNVIRGDPTQVEVALTGDRTETGYGTAGFNISPEIVPALKFDKPGMVGFVNGSQLFITYGALTNLDGRYTVLGEVIEGMDVVQKLAVTPMDANGNLAPGTRITKVTIAVQ